MGGGSAHGLKPLLGVWDAAKILSFCDFRILHRQWRAWGRNDIAVEMARSRSSSRSNKALGRVKRAASELRRGYELMREHFGHQHWWPGETPFEVCVGAILTQNTNWSNVDRAIGNLKAAGVLDPARLYAVEERELARLIRPAGYFNVKARRLRSFLRVLVEEYGGELERLFEGETGEVRARLLGINGVGPETADSMLLYAGGHHSFVIDAYTKRIFHRHGWCGPEADYDELQELCRRSLNHKAEEARLDYWQDFHAQIVMVGKHYCRRREARCEGCPLRGVLKRRKNDE